MDWFTRKVLAWRIFNTLAAEFCLETLNEAIHKFGGPEIMNTEHLLAASGGWPTQWDCRIFALSGQSARDGRCPD